MATWYIDSNGNKHLISGMVTGELPKYTMAEYTALTDKPIDWICTDYDATSEYGINDTEVKHGDTTVNAVLNSASEVLTPLAETNITIKSGGYCKIGKLVVFNVEIQSSQATTSNTPLFRIPIPFKKEVNIPVTACESPNGTVLSGNPRIYCYSGAQSASVYAGASLDTSKSYIYSGSYISMN